MIGRARQDEPDPTPGYTRILKFGFIVFFANLLHLQFPLSLFKKNLVYFFFVCRICLFVLIC